MPLESREIESRILSYLESEILSPDVTVRRDDDLLADELVDSVGVVRLAAFVEKEFELAMQPADFVVENFQSVAVLAEYVRRTARR